MNGIMAAPAASAAPLAVASSEGDSSDGALGISITSRLLPTLGVSISCLGENGICEDTVGCELEECRLELPLVTPGGKGRLVELSEVFPSVGMEANEDIGDNRLAFATPEEGTGARIGDTILGEASCCDW